MAAPVSTTSPLMDWEYELLAGAETTEGYKAWNRGDYPRAIARWKDAIRWEQYARKARGGAQ